jgi:hypothetical protein
MDRDDLAKLSLWPIRLELPIHRGLTLWGSGGDEADRVLAADGHLLLFTSAPQLRDFVQRGADCSFTGLAGYQELQRALRSDPASMPLDPVQVFALDEVERWLSAPQWNWDLARCASVLDGLNLLWDAASTLGDEVTRSSLRRDTGVIGRLADALTFVEEHEISESLAALDRAAIGQAFRDALSRLELRTAVDRGANAG